MPPMPPMPPGIAGAADLSSGSSAMVASGGDQQTSDRGSVLERVRTTLVGSMTPAAT
ncbi:hypothetical protein SKA58_08164, partial [Sphingomonas sp. SKA58]